jgi:transposase InsO family protein
MSGLSLPDFWLGTLVITFAAIWFGWIPKLGYVSLWDNPWQNLQQFLLPAAVLGFLREVVRPTYRQAGWTLRRVLTDNGKEFKGVFAAGCERLRLRVTKTKPRHAWTNGFVERFQGTILHEHWRIAFRREYFGSVRRLQQSLDGFLRFYNRQRAHHGHRLNGRTPATAFFGALAA